MLSLGDMMNTEKALSVIMGIFLSVAIAFIAGTLVQYLSRLIFSFNYKKNLSWTIGIFGGVAVTSLLYFILIKGLKVLLLFLPNHWHGFKTIPRCWLPDALFSSPS